jgi:hypothetical protein
MRPDESSSRRVSEEKGEKKAPVIGAGGGAEAIV